MRVCLCVFSLSLSLLTLQGPELRTDQGKGKQQYNLSPITFGKGTKGKEGAAVFKKREKQERMILEEREQNSMACYMLVGTLKSLSC